MDGGPPGTLRKMDVTMNTYNTYMMNEHVQRDDIRCYSLVTCANGTRCIGCQHLVLKHRSIQGAPIKTIP